jgi:hypothetical protein
VTVEAELVRIEHRPHWFDRDVGTVHWPNGTVAQAVDGRLLASLLLAARDAHLDARKAS